MCTCVTERERERTSAYVLFTVFQMKGTLNSSATLDESFTTVGTNKTWETVADDFENDESPSAPLEVSIPRLHDGKLCVPYSYCNCFCLHFIIIIIITLCQIEDI